MARYVGDQGEYIYSGVRLRFLGSVILCMHYLFFFFVTPHKKMESIMIFFFGVTFQWNIKSHSAYFRIFNGTRRVFFFFLLNIYIFPVDPVWIHYFFFFKSLLFLYFFFFVKQFYLFKIFYSNLVSIVFKIPSSRLTTYNRFANIDRFAAVTNNRKHKTHRAAVFSSLIGFIYKKYYRNIHSCLLFSKK